MNNAAKGWVACRWAFVHRVCVAFNTRFDRAHMRAPPPCSHRISASLLPTLLLSSATIFALLAALIALQSSTILGSKLTALLNFGQYIPFPIICGMLASVGVYFLKMSVYFTAGLPLTAVLSSQPDKLLPIALGAIPPAAAYMFTRAGYEHALTITLLGTVLIPNLLALTTYVDRSDTSLFLSPDIFAYNETTTTIVTSPFYALQSVNSFLRGSSTPANGASICFPAYTATLPTMVTTTLIYLLRHSLALPAFSKSLTTFMQVRSPEPGERCGTHILRSSRFTGSDPPFVHRVCVAFNPNPSLAQIYPHGSSTSSAAPTKTYTVTPTLTRTNSLLFAISPLLTTIFPLMQNSAQVGMYVQYNILTTGPYVYHYLTTLAAYTYMHSLPLYIPTVTFSTLCLTIALRQFTTWLVRPYYILSFLEFASVVTFVVVQEGMGMIAAVGVAAGMCCLQLITGMVGESRSIKFVGSGLTLRSTVDRMASEERVLGEFCDRVAIVGCQGVLFFGNGKGVGDYVRSMFEPAGKAGTEDSRMALLVPVPWVVVLDFSLVTTVDLAAVDVFVQAVSDARDQNCTVVFSGVGGNVRRLFRKTKVDEKTYGNVRFGEDLDASLAMGEEIVLERAGNGAKEEIRVARQKQKEGGSWRECITMVGRNYDVSAATVEMLCMLEERLKVIRVAVGEDLYDVLERKGMGMGGGDLRKARGLFFVECGVIRVERDPNATMNSHGSSLKRRFAAVAGGTMSGVNARSIGMARRAGGAKVDRRRKKQVTQFRCASRGPGTILGGREVSSGMRASGVYTSVVESRLYFLSVEEIEKIERDDPRLALALCKTLASGLASSLDTSYEQGQQYYDVMNARDVVVPKSRRVRGAVQAALDRMNIE